MTSIKLTYNAIHKWLKQEVVSVIGNIFIDNNLVQEQSFANTFHCITNEENFVQQLQKSDGHFAVIIETNDFVFMAVDRMRTFPLFITQKNDTIYISDEITTENEEINTDAINDFMKVYCTLENSTLLSNWQQLQGGEYAVISKKENCYRIKKYYQHTAIIQQGNSEFFKQKLIAVENELIQKTIKYANGRTILIPLSGGYDSRYLLALLHQHNYQKIECFSYGKKDSYEVNIAKKVCDTLKIKWHFIEYTDDLLNVFFSDKWKQYSDKNHHCTSLPHEQDFFALYYLQQTNKLPKNAVVMNGFCQDIHAGSFMKSVSNFNLTSFIKKNYDIYPDLKIYENSWSGYRAWLIKNRLSKFIINSVHVYTYFGLDFYLPFWQINWINYWYSLPENLLLHQSFYKIQVFDSLFVPLKINFIKPDDSSNNSLNKLKNLSKTILPKSIIKFIQSQQQKDFLKDLNNTLFLYNKIYDKLEIPKPMKDFKINNVHAIYFLQNWKQKMNFVQK